MTIRRIGVLTGGGDVPGLNACIKAIALHANELGWDVVGFRGGYHGMLHYNPDYPGGSAHNVMGLSPNIVRTIDRAGGTILHTTRMSPDKLSVSDLPSFFEKFRIAGLGRRRRLHGAHSACASDAAYRRSCRSWWRRNAQLRSASAS